MEWTGPRGRRELAHQFGAGTMDRVHLHWEHCGRPIDDPDFYSIGTADYRTLDELIAHARQGLALASLARRPCPACGQPATLRAADYHTYQCETDRDFVVRWTSAETAPTWHFWDAAGYQPTTTMLDDRYTDDQFADETAMRRAATRASAEGIAAALPDIEAAVSACDGWWELLELVRPLAGIAQTELARDIVIAYIQSHVDEEDDGTEIEQARMEQARDLLDELGGWDDDE